MQDKKLKQFKIAVGEILKEIRQTKTDLSITRLAYEYEFDKGNISRTERGNYNIQLATAWKLCEALNISFSDFAKLLENKLGKNFSFIDD